MKKTCKKLFRNSEGIALIEFVMVFPILFMLVFVVFELTRYIIIMQKLDKATYVLTDIVGQMDSATMTGSNGNHNNEIGVRALEDNVLNRFSDILAPFDDNGHGIRISSVVVSNPSGTAATSKLRWRMEKPFGSPTVMTMPASLASSAAPANFLQNGASVGNTTTCYDISWTDSAIQQSLDGTSGGASAYDGENFILGEFYYQYTPIMQPLITAVTGIFGMNSGIFGATLRRDAFLIPRAGFLLDLPNPRQFNLGASATFPGPTGATTTTLLGEKANCL